MKKIRNTIVIITIMLCLIVDVTIISDNYKKDSNNQFAIAKIEPQGTIHLEPQIDMSKALRTQVSGIINQPFLDSKKASEIFVESSSNSIHDIPDDEVEEQTSDCMVEEEITSEVVPTLEQEKAANLTPSEFVYSNISYNYTEEELETLAHLLYAEAGSDWISDTTIYYVASVVMNRVNSPNYPNTVLEVIYQEGQYSPTWNGFMNNNPTPRCYEIAQIILERGSVLPSGVLGQAGKSVYDKYGKGLYCLKDTQYFFYT